MLKSIRCDAFVSDLNILTIKPGLNTIQGSSLGSNAIGKSTFLWIVDFIFGGQKYAKLAQDIKKHISGDLTVYFSFEFDGKLRYFYRKPEDYQKIFECTPDWRTIIDEMEIRDYQEMLRISYNLDTPGLTLSGLMDHFFRIYGRGNANEWHPMKADGDTNSSAEDFLLILFQYGRLLVEIANMEQALNIKAHEVFLKSPMQMVDYKLKREENQAGIKAMQERLADLMLNKNGEMLFADLGLDTKTIEAVTNLQKELRQIMRQYESLKSQQAAVENNLSDSMTVRAEEFTALQRFFPNANMQAFENIEKFHNQLRAILQEEMKNEIARLQPLISFYESEIKKLQERIQKSSMTRSIAERVMSQCISARQRLEELQAEAEQIDYDEELQNERIGRMTHLKELADQHKDAIADVEQTVSDLAEKINAVITSGKERPPVLTLSGKDITFETKENTSEGTAFKNLVIYDLCLLYSCPIPILIHDSNILKKIDDAYLEPILQQYQQTGKQIFIVMDKVDSVPAGAQRILDDTTLMHLKDGHELFGYSWSKVTQPTETTEVKE